jgi:hypothetical protein
MMLTITGNRMVLHNDGVPPSHAPPGRQVGRQHLARSQRAEIRRSPL